MLAGIYSNLSSVEHANKRRDVTANNLANISTTGFRESYLMLRTREVADQTADIDSDAAARMPESYGSQRAGVFKNMLEPGQVRATGNPLNIALDPSLKNAWFSVQTEQGTAYTRNGTLSVGLSDPNNPASSQILLLNGHPAIDAAGGQIAIDPNAGQLVVRPDGIVQQGQATIGQLPVYRMNRTPDVSNQVDADVQQLESRGEGLLVIPEGATDIYPLALHTDPKASKQLMSQGFLEGSNVNMMKEMTELIQQEKDSQSNMKGMTLQFETLQRLFQMAKRQ